MSMSKTRSKSQLVTLVLGDDSGDGHEKRESMVFKINCTSDELKEAYAIGCKKLGFNFANKCCEEYEDRSLSAEYADKLKAAGINVDDIVESYDGEYSFWRDTYAEMWLEVAKLGRPELKWKESTIKWISIGGYGLFS